MPKIKEETEILSNNEYVLNLTALLEKQKSKSQINTDIKDLEKVLRKVRLVATLTKGTTKTQINQTIQQLEAQLRQVRLQAKVDNRQLNREINNALRNMSARDIQLNFNSNGERLNAQVRRIISQAREFADRNPIRVNIDLKREKLLNQLTTFINKNTKINESSYWLSEAERLRTVISSVTNRDELRNATDQLQVFTSGVRATGYATVSTTDKIKGMLGNILKIGNYFGLAFVAVNKFRQSLNNLKDMDTILTEISKVSEMTAKQLDELGDRSYAIASKYGVLANNFMKSFQEMSRAGFGEDKTQSLAELATLTQSAGNLTAELSNEYLIASNAAYGYSGSVEKLNALLDAQNQVTNRNAVSLTELADATKVAANQLANASISEQEMTALLGTGIATTKESGQVVGRAVKAIVMNLQQVQNTEEGLETTAEDLGKVESCLDSLGIKMKETADGITRLRNPVAILSELAEVYNSLPKDSVERANIISDIGGKYRGNVLSSILTNWDTYIKMMGDYEDAAGSALREAEKSADSWEGRLAQLQNSWDSFVASLTDKDTIKGSISFLDSTIQAFEKLVDTVGVLPVMLTTINASMASLNKNYGITQIYNKDTRKIDLQGNFMGINITAYKTQIKHFRDAKVAMASWNNSLIDGTANVNNFNNATVQNNEQLKAYLQTTSADAPASLNGYIAYLNAAGISTDALRLKTILLNSAISMGIGVAIQVAVQGITYLIQREEKLRQVTEEAANAYKESSKSIDDYISKYQELHKALIAAQGNEEETYSIKKQLLELQTELNDKFGDEYGAINLVTEAYKDQTEVIKALNKETAQRFLNENKEGIDKSEKEMTKERHYNLSYTGLVGNTDKGEALKEIAEKYKGQGITLLDEYGDGSYLQFSIHLDADAQSAYETINAFENDLRDKAKELGNEHMFDDVLNVSSNSLNKAKETIEKYGDTYRQALTAEIVSDDDKAKTYGEALKAVEAYNEAVLRSENPYDDQNVVQAKENLDAIKTSIQDNEAEWGKYSSLFDDVFGQADTRLLEFNEALKTDSRLKELAENLEGLSDIDLKALNENVGDNNSFDKLKEAAAGYKINVDELIDALVRLGYVQGEIKSTVLDTTESIPTTISSSIQQIATQLEPQFAKLGEAYKAIFTSDGFTLNDVDNSMLENLRKSFAEIENEVGVAFDSSKLEPFFDTLTNGNSSAEQVQQAFNELATAYLYSTDTLEQLNAETAGAIEKQLEEMGVQNAAEVVTEALTAKTEELIVAKEYLTQTGKELASATEDERTAFILEQIEAGNCGEALALLQLKKVLLNQSTITTAVDCQNILALAQAANIGIQQLQQLQTLMNIITQRDAAVQNGDSRAVSELNRAINEFSSNVVSNLNLENIQVDFGNIGGGKSAASKAGTSAADAYVDAYKQELKELEHMHEMGLISDEEYWKARMDLNEKYFGESSGMHQKYLEEYQDNEEEILKGIKNLWKDYYDDRKNDLKDLISYAEKLYDKEIDSLDDSIKKLEEKRDTEKKYWQAQIDDIDAEIDALEEANDERERAINLQEKQYQLQKAMHQRTILLYSESKGMHYVHDDDAVKNAKNDLDDAEHDNKVADLKKQQKDLQKQLDSILETYDLQIEAIEKQIDSLREVKSAWSDIVENQEFKEIEEKLKSIFGDDIKDKILSGNTDFMNSIVAQYSDTSDMLRTIEDATLADIQSMIAQYGMLPENLMPITDIINDMADGFSNVADSASNAASAISGNGNVSTRSNNQASNNNNPSGNTGNSSSLKDAITEATTGSVEEINKISDAFAGENEESTSVTGAIQKVMDKIGSAESGKENSDSLMSTLTEQTKAALDEENGIPAQTEAWTKLNEPLGEAVESVTTLKSSLEDMNGKEFTVTLNVTGNSSPNSIVSEFGSAGHHISNGGYSHGGGGHSRVEGAGKYKGLPQAEKNALVSEYGQTEMTVLPDGKTIITDEPTMMDLPKDTVIYNEEQTKKIIDNKVDVSGNAHAEGTGDGTWIGADGHRYRDIQPGDRAYELQKAFEPLLNKWLSGEEDIISNAVFEGQRQMERWTKEITNNTAINNITNKNVQQPIVNNINVTCPGVTSQQVAEQIGDVLDKELDKKFNGLHLKAMQYTW